MLIYQRFSLFWRTIGPLFGLYTLANFLDLSIHTIQTTLIPLIPPMTLGNIFWFFVTVFVFFFTYVEYRHKNIPLTILNTSINLELLSSNGDHAIMTRSQVIRANQENITGFHRTMRVDSPEQIPHQDITCYIDHCDASEQSIVFKSSQNDGSSVELTHRFKQPIPRYLSRLGLNTVTRSEKVTIKNAYTKKEEYFTLFIPAEPPHYRHKKITLRILFHPNRLCGLENCQAVRISHNGVIDQSLKPVFLENKHGVELEVKKPLPGDRYRITWRYPDH